MPINPIYNDIEMGTAWAEDAATTIPSVPVPGIAYRNTGLSDETVGTGQQYDSIGRSADWNELLYKISANIITLQRGGATLLWISGRQYEQGALVKDPNNAQIYYRKKAGAGTTRPSSDSTNWQLLQDLFKGDGLVLDDNNKLVWGTTTDAPTNTNCNNIKTSGVYRISSNVTSNCPTDVESTGTYYGFLVVMVHNADIIQVAYEIPATSFSYNVRTSNNSGSTWTNWERFGVNFTLDWNSGHDYRVGDLVRDTSNSLLYVCTTAVSNSTQRPGLDASHFNLLSSYISGYGLGVVNNEICWGGTYNGVPNNDLNQGTVPGLYWCNNSISNKPTTVFGICMCIKNNALANSDNTAYFQIYITNKNDGSKFYFRSGEWSDGADSCTWNDWIELASIDCLDFVSGQTYNQGQLVRGSNNVHYVKKTAASVCNTEPNSDSANFETLAQNLVNLGLAVDGGTINWGLSLEEVSDCNSVIDVGTYRVPSGTTNSPTTIDGFLIVLSSGATVNSGYRMQIYFSSARNNNEVYVRTDSDNHTAWSNWIKIGPTEVPEGNIFATGDFVATYRSAREGFLLCNGTAVSRTTYAALFSVIGTKFGTGDGSTTFNLPDFRGRVIQGANGNLGTSIAAGLPNISGTFSVYADWLYANGAFSGPRESTIRAGGSDGGRRGFNFNASSSNAIYGKSTTVQPPAIALNILIKY